MNYKYILNLILQEYKAILKENLVGIYIHGSIALGCFNWDKSDIDYIVIVNEKLSLNTKLKLMESTIKINSLSTNKGLEMSIVLKEYCTNFIYPTPFELHFSNSHINSYIDDPVNYCETMNGLDKDLAAHFTIIKNHGLVLYGASINSTFPYVPNEDYIDSIKYDINDAKSEIFNNPIYIILNLCRVLAYLKDDLILSKEQGGYWGINNLDNAFKELINEAIICYKTNKSITLDYTSNKFCDYMLKEIDSF